MKLRLVSLMIFSFFFFSFINVYADEYDDITKQLGELRRSLDLSQKATTTNEEQLQKLNVQLSDIKAKVAGLEAEIIKKETEVKEGEKALAYQKTLLDERAVSYYKNLTKNSFGIIEILISENITITLQNFFYQKSLQDEDRKAIVRIALYIKNLEDKKATLEGEKGKLSIIKQEVDKQSQFLAGEVSKAKKYEGELQQKIAVLSARQQEIIAQKQASLNIPKSAGTTLRGCIDDRDIDPGFSPRIAFFTYGVPNRVGLNQYGAKGRADAGQNGEQILQAYYTGYELKKDYDAGINITVDGYGTFNIEDYVKRIYEMPESWPIEALKAQAVAARSYALARTGNGARSICATEYCQVFKPDPKGGAWEQAVNDTRGWVMVSGGNPISAQYSSTHGGYMFSNSSWTKNAADTTTGSAGSFSDVLSNAYDKSSPWFYCDWGSRPEYNKTAWLKSNEITDIVNVLLLAKRDDGSKNHLYQPDKPNPAGTDTWDPERVKSELRNKGGVPFSTITDASVSVDFGSGKASSVNFSGDGGSVSFSASEFKDWFNLRAPANIQIVGPLFNVERR